MEESAGSSQALWAAASSGQSLSEEAEFALGTPYSGLLLVRSVNLSQNQKKSGASEPAAPLELGNEWWPPGLCYLHFTTWFCYAESTTRCFSSRQRSSGRFLHRPLRWEIPTGANNPASSTNLVCCCLLSCRFGGSDLLESLPTLPLCSWPGDNLQAVSLVGVWATSPVPLSPHFQNRTQNAGIGDFTNL